MPGRWESTPSAMTLRAAAMIFMLTAAVDEAAADGTSYLTPRAVDLRSSSGAIAAPIESSLPPNLVVADMIRPLVTSMWGLSRTFRRQCARLTKHPEILVQIRIRLGVSNGRAQAVVQHEQGRRHVEVQIEQRKPELYVEYIAHELEHVLETVDGMDLPRLARQRVDGVMDLGGRYETVRAESVGRMVAREVTP